MSAVDLVILGLLKRTPSNPYEMARSVEQSRTRKIIKIGSPTIYQNIKKLAKKGFLASHTVKEGEMPEKSIYRLTDAGESYFMELMAKFSADPGRMFFSFNSFIKNLTLVEKEVGLSMLRDLKLYFFEMKNDLEKDMADIQSPPFEVRIILKQYRILIQGMITWVDETIKEYQEI